MVPTVRPVVVTLGGAERVAMVPPKFVPVPTASQLTGLAHMTPDKGRDSGWSALRLSIRLRHRSSR